MEGTKQNRYEYRPLNLEEREIRLVEILPIVDNVHIRLHTYSLDKPPAYEALSYAWGPLTTPPKDILCEGAHIGIGSNLNDFLVTMRGLLLAHGRRRCPLIWIDAISINQKDAVETRATIQWMPKIYVKATRTLCWLGRSPLPGFPVLRDTMCNLVDSMQDFISFSDVDHTRSRIKVGPEGLQRFRASTQAAPEVDWECLDQILSDTYFTRAWILTDFITSPNLVLLRGESEIPWTLFADFLLLCVLFNTGSVPGPKGAINVIICEALRLRFHSMHAEVPTSAEILLAFRYCSAATTYLSDYVNAPYTIIHLLHPEVSVRLGIDYHTDPVVFANTSKFLNDDSKSLISLSLLGGMPQPQFDRTTESWAINWDRPYTRFLLNHPKSTFSATKEHEVHASYFLSEAEPNTLKCTGLVADTLLGVSSYLPARRPCDHYNVNGSNSYVFDEWYAFVTGNIRSLKKEADLLLEFADTIQAKGSNHVWERQDCSPAERVQQVKEFLNYLEDEDVPLTDTIRIFYAACYQSHDRRLAVTKSKRLCLVPKDAKSGDLVCVLHGNRVPVIFRPIRETPMGYKNIGEAYVHGMMQYETAGLEDIPEGEFMVY